MVIITFTGAINNRHYTVIRVTVFFCVQNRSLDYGMVCFADDLSLDLL